MSHHHHQQHNHTQPLIRKDSGQSGHAGKGAAFGALVGKYDHWTLSAHDGTHENPNHVYVWLRVEGQTTAKYEAAFNVLSNRAAGEAAELQAAVVEESVAKSDWPAQGFSANAHLSFDKLALKQSDFRTTSESELRDLIESYSSNSQLMKILGVPYPSGDGIHDIHMNVGHQDQDGAAVFYSEEADGPVARWLFLKFSNEVLAA